MNRAEAEARLGSRVQAWTSANGVYVGRLVEVIPARPWRGIVEIEGILQPAVVYERGRRPRRGFRPGERIEVGGTNISPCEAAGATDYLALLEAQARRFQETAETYRAGGYGDPKDQRVERSYGWYGAAVKDVEAAIALEKERLQGIGSWARR